LKASIESGSPTPQIMDLIHSYCKEQVKRALESFQKSNPPVEVQNNKNKRRRSTRLTATVVETVEVDEGQDEDDAPVQPPPRRRRAGLITFDKKSELKGLSGIFVF